MLYHDQIYNLYLSLEQNHFFEKAPTSILFQFQMIVLQIILYQVEYLNY